MQFYGEALMGLTLLIALVASGISFLGARFRRDNMIDAGRQGLYAITALSWAMSFMLSYSFLTHDFSNGYVATYSDKAMPTPYLLAAFWGGEKGAVLLWVLMLATFSSISVRGNRDKDARWIGVTTGLLLLSIAFFLILLVFESNPFATFLTHGGPADGKGMNPLLQNPTMMIHPPSLLTGYICFTIPFAYGLAALIVRKLDTEWIRVTRFWTIISWIFLSVGLVLGGMWAYMEQGWGGFWMWDAVENAGLIPWFTATAFLHSVMIQERRGMLKRWNAILLCLPFLLTIFGTFLTRTQLIVSIHSFADSTLPNYFFVYMMAIFMVSIVAIAYRWADLASENRVDSFWSRESFFVLNNVILVACAFIVIWGTLYPKMSELTWFRDFINFFIDSWNYVTGLIPGGAIEPADRLLGPEDLGEPWFNRVMPYFAIPLLFLTGAGPIIAWRRASFSNIRKAFVVPINLALVATALTIWIFHTRAAYNLTDRGLSLPDATRAADLDIRVLLVFFCGYFVLFTIFMEYARAVRIRRSKMGGNPIWHAIVLTLKARRRFGGYIVHLGIVMCFFAFAGSAVKTYIPDQVMYPGYSVDLDHYRVTLTRIDEVYVANGDYVASRATMVVTNRGESNNSGKVDQIAKVFSEHDFSPVKIRLIDGSAKIHLFFSDDTDRQRFLAAMLLQTDLNKNYVRLKDDVQNSSRIYRFKHEKVLENHPQSFMRHVRNMKAKVAALTSLGVRAKFTPGSPVFALSFPNPDSLAAFDDIDELSQALPKTLYAQFGDSPNEVEIITDGTGHILVPEVRFYTKHETPTTEVATQGDLFQELYLAMRPAMGREFISLSGFVNPLVSFLWIGSLILVIGAIIALLPDWAVSFIRRPSAPSGSLKVRKADAKKKALHVNTPRGPTAALIALSMGALLLSGLSMEGLRAQDSIWKKRANIRVAQAGAMGVVSKGTTTTTRTLTPFLERISCPRRSGGSWGVMEEKDLGSCTTKEGDLIRDLLQTILEQNPSYKSDTPAGRMKVLEKLVQQDGRVDRLLRFDESKFSELWHSAKCLCGCNTHILFQCGPECGPKDRWRQHFRLMLTAGYPQAAVLEDYRKSHRKKDGSEYTTEEMLKDPKKKKQSWAIPAFVGLIIVVFIYLSLFRKKKSLLSRAISHLYVTFFVPKEVAQTMKDGNTGKQQADSEHDESAALQDDAATTEDHLEEEDESPDLSAEINDLLEDIDDP